MFQWGPSRSIVPFRQSCLYISVGNLHLISWTVSRPVVPPIIVEYIHLSAVGLVFLPDRDLIIFFLEKSGRSHTPVWLWGVMFTQSIFMQVQIYLAS